MRVLIADDQSAFRAAATAVVSETPGFEVCGSVGRATHVPPQVEALHPDLLLLDVRMPGEDPLSMAIALMRRHRQLRVLLVSAFGRDDVPVECFAAGMGFLQKEDLAPQTLLSAVRSLPPHDAR